MPPIIKERQRPGDQREPWPGIHQGRPLRCRECQRALTARSLHEPPRRPCVLRSGALPVPCPPGAEAEVRTSGFRVIPNLSAGPGNKPPQTSNSTQLPGP